MRCSRWLDTLSFCARWQEASMNQQKFKEARNHKRRWNYICSECIPGNKKRSAENQKCPRRPCQLPWSNRLGTVETATIRLCTKLLSQQPPEDKPQPLQPMSFYTTLDSRQILWASLTFLRRGKAHMATLLSTKKISRKDHIRPSQAFNYLITVWCKMKSNHTSITPSACYVGLRLSAEID